MKSFLIILVVVVHLVLIGWMFRGDSDEPAGPPEPALSDEHAASQPPAPSRPAPPETIAVRARLLATARPRVSVPAPLEQKLKGCRTGVLVDWSAKQVLWQKRLEEPVPIASLTKMMTALLLVDYVREQPGVSLETDVQVSKATAEVGGSQVYMDPRESFTFDEILKCIMIFSANDAAHLAAETVAGGDVAGFVAQMNARARAMGLRSLRFHNPHGLPGKSGAQNNVGAALDLAVLGGELLDYPEVCRWSGTWLSYLREDTGKRFQLANRNRLIKDCPGVNGMKTGFTQKAGFCVTATCERGGRKLVAVVTGCQSSKGRNDVVCALLDWGYAQAAGRTSTSR